MLLFIAIIILSIILLCCKTQLIETSNTTVVQDGIEDFKTIAKIILIALMYKMGLEILKQ